MKMIWIIFRKEFFGFFKSPLFYLLAFLSTILLSITFSMGLQNFAMTQSNSMFQMGISSQQMNIHYSVFLQHLSFLNLMFMFFVPALAMRLLAEEKKNRTFDLLLTSPIESYQIVAGKFLSLFSVVFTLTAIACIYFVISRRMFDFTWAPTLIAALGILLVGAVYSALSLFASSLTENTMISFSLGIVFNIALWVLGGLSDLFDGPITKPLFDQISLNQHLQAMIEGVLKTNGLIFFASLIFLFCFITERLIESARWRA